MKIVVAVVVLALLLLAPPVTSQVPDDKLIVPGQRIGKWTLEMTIDDLLQMNGPRRAIGGGSTIFRLPDRDLISSDFWVHRWDHLGFRVVTLGRENQRIWNLAALSPDYKTDRGIGSGATRQAVEAAYGMPTAVTRPDEESLHLIYDQLGLALRVFDQAVNVLIFRPGTAKERWKF